MQAHKLNSESFELSLEDFEFFAGLIEALAGINITIKKQELVKSRLRSHIQSLNLDSFSSYRKYLENLSPGDSGFQIFVNLLTTNKTDFFREPKHFEFLRDFLTTSNRIGSNVNLWCCASSTGQEPYTLAMVLREALSGKSSFKILATDVDTEVLKTAKNGVYQIEKLVEIPEAFHADNIKIGQGTVSSWFKISESLRKNIHFQQHNLIDDGYPNGEAFDIIFCRNVLIYFSPDTILALMKKLHKSLKKDGLLFIGHSEAIRGSEKLFEVIQPAVYRKIG